MGVYDVPASMLIEHVAKDLKGKVKQPAFVPYVKTGVNRERAPTNPDWFYHRTASVLYRVYKNGALGTGALRSYYGGRKNRGVRPEHKYKASGKIIRLALQSLEKEGLVKKDKKGRKITPKGEKLLFAKAKEAEVAFRSLEEKESIELVERRAKAEQARQKMLTQQAAQEAARKQAAEQARKEAEKRAAARAAEQSKPAEKKAETALAKKEDGKAEKKKDFAPAG